MGDLPRPLRGLAMTDGVRISEGRIAMAPAGPRNDRGAIGVHRSLPSLPCARGGGTAQAVTEGLCAGSAEPRPAGERIAASLRSSQSTCIYECTTVNETCVCRARPLGVPFAGSCFPFPTAKRRAGSSRPTICCCFIAMTAEKTPGASVKIFFSPPRPGGRSGCFFHSRRGP